ncbi:hypothetical protein TNCT_251411 [Trichonephila clavata]|uniref:Uncharacterized protein n=1 Tax=Trichonephila clavata TaxID=2740835 RepID=A0A8X6J3G1_TRICU|nr:hypothetical protein TNCT_251411 [Trichonephila clavata]
MRFILILFFAVLAIASAQRRVGRPPSRRLYRLPVHRHRDDDQHFASLGGADVGRYSQGWTVLPRTGWTISSRINLEGLIKEE